MLKFLAFELCEPLSIIFRVSFNTGEILSVWKCADISALFKNGDATDASNYRPISLTSAVCKVFERLFVNDLLTFLRRNSLLCQEQFGFLAKRSTVLQLLSCSYDWLKGFDSGCATDIVYIDYAKAFDTVGHAKLLYKLETGYNIRNRTLQWLCSFLSNRLQRVRINRSFSVHCMVRSGDQESVLGPILFLLYINDVPHSCSADVSMKLFADDTKLYFKFKDVAECSVLQCSLDSFADWSDQWQLKVAPSKSCVLTVGSNREALNYELHSDLLKVVDSYRDLGVKIDSDLSFRTHINEITSTAYRIINLLFCVFTVANTTAYIRAYTSYVRPILEFNSPVWSPHYVGLIDKIEGVQRNFTKRVMLRCNAVDPPHYLARLDILGLDSLELRRIKADLVLLYQIVNGNVDSPSEDMFSYANTVTRGHQFKLKTTFARTSVFNSSFSNRIVPIWNSLPHTAVSKSSVSSFKHALNLYVELRSLCKFCHNM